jgi:hypothetical protein
MWRWSSAFCLQLTLLCSLWAGGRHWSCCGTAPTNAPANAPADVMQRHVPVDGGCSLPNAAVAGPLLLKHTIILLLPLPLFLMVMSGYRCSAAPHAVDVCGW